MKALEKFKNDKTLQRTFLNEIFIISKSSELQVFYSILSLTLKFLAVNIMNSSKVTR